MDFWRSLIVVVVGWFFIKGVSPTRGEVVLARFGKNTLSTFPVQVFAYTSVVFISHS